MPSNGVWLECNGQSTSGYEELAAIYGANVPDYRGIFLRGYGSSTSVHFGTIIHQSSELNQIQGDSIRNITGNISGEMQKAYGVNGCFSYISIWNDKDWSIQSGSYPKIKGFYFNAANVVPTSNEVRPINKAVIYLIKAK